MNYVGLFEGISGFGLAFKRAGANILAVCEIDKTCQSVLRRHHPNAEIISDVKTITKDSFNGLSVSILAGGFPCQDLSVAGQRKGLAGERSGLWFEFIRIIGDHKPRWVVIENVPGLLSSNGGRDFAVVLRGLAECGYFSAYRVFDSQYDGVAQRRNRVFIVASLGAASCIEVLFERESSQWDSPPRREAGQGVAPTLESGANRTGGTRPPGTTVDTATSLVPFGGGNTGGSIDVATTCNAHGMRLDFDSETFLVAPTLRSNGDAHSGFTTGDGLVVEMPEVAGCLDSGSSSGGAGRPGLTVQSASAGHCFPVAYNLTFCDANGRRADRPNGGLYVNKTERANTLTSGEQGKTLVTQAFQINASDEVRTSDIAYTLNTNGNATGRNSPTIAGQFGVRRLTPTECERLQGFPDGWTAFGHDDKPISDSARYRMLGNAVCVPTAEWIARRIVDIENKGQR